MEQERKLSEHVVIVTLYLAKAHGSLSWALSFPCLDSGRGADAECLDVQGQKKKETAKPTNTCPRSEFRAGPVSHQFCVE